MPQLRSLEWGAAVKVKVKYFALLREIVGVGEEEYELDEETKLIDLLLNHIPRKHKDASEVFKDYVGRFLRGESTSYIVIVNGDRANPNQELKDGDVVAVLPPVGGG